MFTTFDEDDDDEEEEDKQTRCPTCCWLSATGSTVSPTLPPSLLFVRQVIGTPDTLGTLGTPGAYNAPLTPLCKVDDQMQNTININIF